MKNLFTPDYISNIGFSGWAILVITCTGFLLKFSYNLWVNRKNNKRKSLYRKLRPLWDRNYQIFLEFGPHPQNDTFFDLEGDATLKWRKKVKEIMLPNHQKILDLCFQHIELMTKDEEELFYQYEDHVADFKSCHESGYQPGKTFPNNITKIFKDEI